MAFRSHLIRALKSAEPATSAGAITFAQRSESSHERGVACFAWKTFHASSMLLWE